MSANFFTQTGVSVTADWTELVNKTLPSSKTGVGLTFQIANQDDSAADVNDIAIQLKDHADGDWHEHVFGEEMRGPGPRVISIYKEAGDPAPRIEPGLSAHYVLKLEPFYLVRVLARSLSGTATVDIHGFAEQQDPNERTDTFVDFLEGAAPGTPNTGYVRVYAKTDGHLYKKDDAGAELGLVCGPSSATANRVVRTADTSGKLIASSGATVNAGGDMTVATLGIGGYVALDKSIFNANTVLLATADNTPVATTMAEQTLVGRVTGGNPATLTANEALGIIADRLACIHVASRTYDGLPFGGTNTAADLVIAADTIYAHRFYSWGKEYDAIGIRVRTAEAGKGCKMAIFNEGSDGYPSSLVLQTGALSLAVAADIETAGLAQTLPVGWYWVAILSDSAGVAKLESMAMAYHRMLGHTDYSTNAGTLLTKAGEPYADGFDDPFPAGAAYGITNVHRILLKRSA